MKGQQELAPCLLSAFQEEQEAVWKQGCRAYTEQGMLPGSDFCEEAFFYSDTERM